MATDYDAPRVTESDEADTSLEQLTASRKDTQSPVVDVEDSDTAESFELPGADLSGEELTVRVIPKQADEFTCTSCSLVHHRSRLADAAQLVCRDCA
ncbi:dUTPase [Rhodococcus sp. SC4]|nr:dUTPase [Rhodococcus sp. SC4]